MDTHLVNRELFRIDEFTEFMILKNFSRRTIKTYTQIVVHFVAWWLSLPKSVPMSDEVVRKYLLFRFEQGMDWQTVNSDYSAIQKWFKNVLFLEWRLTKLPRPKRENKLPSVLARQEVISIIQSAKTFKHQTMLTFIYATGLRLSETIAVKIEDIDGHRKLLRVNKGKGSKDRMVLLPDTLLRLLRAYYKAQRPEVYLFNSNVKGKPLSERAVQLAMFEAKKAAGVSKKGSIHTLRNCYATHHLEGGTDLLFLQAQMGHKNLRTTIRYIGLCVERQRFINHPVDQMSIQYLM
jgi:integrase/recombinase XerD